MSRLTDLLRRIPLNPVWVEKARGQFSRVQQSRIAQKARPWLEKLYPWIEKARQVGLLKSQMRFVLTIGDEGATLVQFSGRAVVDATFVAPDAEDGPGTIRSFLDQDSSAQLLVSADVLEQMYREEQMPRAGRLDRFNILKRRLEIAFPHDRLRAALPMERGSNTALFTALPVTPNIEQWIEFLESLPNPVVGFCMLPMESAELAIRLAPTEEGEERRVWHALVTQQATSGFRQIFVSDGRLVVTRLTQRPPGELSAGAVALLIERELRSSISYIKRLGYTDFDRLDLVVLADPEVCAAVESRELPVTTLTAHTPRQAGEILDYGEVGPEDSPYSDVLHAACLAAKRRPIVVLPTEKFRDRSNTDRAFRAGFVSAAALTLFTLLYVGSLLFDAYDTQTEADVLTAQMATEQQALDLARNKVKGFAIPLDDLLLVGQSEESFAKHQINPTNLLRSLAGTLEPSYRLVRLTYAVPAPQQANSGGATPVKRGFPGFGGDNKKEAETLFELRFTVRFSGDRSQPELIIQQAKDLKDRLARAMPDHEVSVVQLPLNQMRNQVLEGNTAVGLPTGIPTADYLVRKRL